MKNYLIILLLFLIVGCSKDLDTLQDRGGIYYEINSEKPFSGSVKEFDGSDGDRYVRRKGKIKNGKEDGLWTQWYENGQKSIEVTYKNGKENGLWIGWYKNGQKNNEGNFKDGKRDSLWTYWNESGQKEWELTYKDGKEDGLIILYSKNGQKSSEWIYKDGERVSFKCCDEHGKEGGCFDLFDWLKNTNSFH